MDCENCGNADMSFSAEWLGHHVCYECNQRGFGLASDYRARAEKAERERDEARGFAVYAEAELYVGEWTGYFRACSPAGLLGQDGSWDGRTPAKRFATAVEAEKAGRAVPWWEVKA